MNKYFVIDYKLYSVKNGERTLEEETTEDEPFVLISGFGISYTAPARVKPRRGGFFFDKIWSFQNLCLILQPEEIKR